jgi:hypothetical protein
VSGIPLLTIGQVYAHAPDNGGVRVILRSSGQDPGYVIRMGYTGPADTLRIRQRPLPTRGSWGLIAFPYGDIRNGVWICTILPSLADALTSTASGASALDPFIDYESHYSGFWKMLDGLGQLAMEFPDGSSFVLGSGSTLPTTYRHTVTSGNAREKIPFVSADRVPNPPPPFVLNLAMKSGATIAVDASGNVSVSTVGNVAAIASGTASILASGNVSAHSASGSVSLTDGKGSNFTLSNDNNGSATMAGTLTLACNVIVTKALTVSGVVTGESTGSFPNGDITVLGSHTIAGHTHTQGNDSHGDTEMPTNTPTG